MTDHNQDAVSVTGAYDGRSLNDWERAVEIAAGWYGDDYPDDRDIRIAVKGIEVGRKLSAIAPGGAASVEQAADRLYAEARRLAGANEDEVCADGYDQGALNWMRNRREQLARAALATSSPVSEPSTHVAASSVAVQASDRRIAARTYAAIIAPEPVEIAEFMSGKFDNSDIVKAFAEHRNSESAFSRNFDQCKEFWPTGNVYNRLGSWLSAALDDPNTGEAFKSDIQAWFGAGGDLGGNSTHVAGEGLEATAWLYRRPNESYPTLPDLVRVSVQRLSLSAPWVEIPLFAALDPAPPVDGEGEKVGDPNLLTANRLARRMGAHFVPHDYTTPAQKPDDTTPLDEVGSHFGNGGAFDPSGIPAQKSGEDSVPEGMVAWHGGDRAPEDWDGRPVMLSTGDMIAVVETSIGWQKGKSRADIIAYTPKAPRQPAADARASLDFALQPFARIGGLIDLETTGFDDTDQLQLITEDGHLLDRFEVGDFRRAALALGAEERK